ncbi:cytochrome c oxidase subunit II [Ideonella sp. BN130291]|uniref:cytochrome c oxidase subunit II n=1 Tax=Ideonella sp. BN130291 TaxID=3112940 RepID=UPI002E271908|nr:cytochrome c oxidase subunit II [Ideonella sp. BN130291]
MAIAVALVVIVVGSLLFHFLNPWQATPLASNWQSMDDTLTITFVITGLFFVVINLLLVYTVWRFRHRSGHKAAYAHDNKKLERWLIIGTSVGVAALLTPGLFVYARYVDPPADALVMEVVAQQWQWRFRFPGGGGKLGGTDTRFVKADNPFGLDPSDANGQDDVLVDATEVHLPLNRPVKVVARSHDALHDFYVPPFRARMNIVPGQVSSFWFTPTQAGRFEALCAQLCGVGHPNMRGVVVVEDEAAFLAWLQRQPTFARSQALARANADTPAARGRALAQAKACLGCHSVDGNASAGPTWKGLFGRNEALADGSSVKVDDTYLRHAIREPQAQVVKGFANIMPPTPLSDEEVAQIVAYIKSLGG